MKRKLTKSPNNVVLTGSLAGIADWLGIDPTIIRVVYVLLSFFSAFSQQDFQAFSYTLP